MSESGDPQAAVPTAEEDDAVRFGDGAASGEGDAPATAELCPSCGAELVDEARFCEACGASVAGDDAGASTSGVPTAEIPAVAVAEEACVHCGAPVDPDGYCTSCGLRAVEPVDVVDRGPVAYATHRGRRHPRNEDSGGLATTSEGWPILVVSDGVSASPNPHLASAAAVEAVVSRLDGQPFTGPDVLRDAVLAAHDAACAISADGDPLWVSDGTHPACTIVVMVAAPDVVHVANVGDARAYLVSRAGDGDGTWQAVQLSIDDSVAALAVREGIEPARALTLPGGHAITAWLGADGPRPDVHVATQAVVAGNLALACSDGLWNYAPTEAELGERLDATVPAPPAPLQAASACEALVTWAIDQGGSDNICVALSPVGAAPAEPVPREQEEQAS